MTRNYGPAYASPLALWLFLFFAAPIAIVLSYSFMAKGLYGGVLPRFSPGAYRTLANPTLLRVALNTAGIAAASTILMVALALPAAYFIARSPRKNTLLLLVIVPFWTNLLIRIYAWIAILGNNGILNSLLFSAGLTADHVQFLYNRNAIVLVTVYAYLPYAILPLYASIEKFDFTLIEAARDLGASSRQATARVLLPNIQPGIVTAILFTFIPAFGAYAIPQILGGRESLMLGTIIARELTVTRNWPLASSISVAITILTTLGVVFFMRLQTQAAARAREVR